MKRLTLQYSQFESCTHKFVDGGHLFKPKLTRLDKRAVSGIKVQRISHVKVVEENNSIRSSDDCIPSKMLRRIERKNSEENQSVQRRSENGELKSYLQERRKTHPASQWTSSPQKTYGIESERLTSVLGEFTLGNILDIDTLRETISTKWKHKSALR